MSETTMMAKTWGEREGVSLELLKKFTTPGHEQFGHVRMMWNYRGDLTESGDRRMRASLGEEAYEHHHYDALACNRSVLVVVPRWKFKKDEDRELMRLGAEYWWAMSEIASADPDPFCEVRPATEREIAKVSSESRELLAELPGLEFMALKKVGYYSSNKPGRRLWKKAPAGVRYFRFAAGYGLVSI